MLDAAWLIPAFPIIGFILLVLFGRGLGEPFAGWLASLASLASFVATVIAFVELSAIEEAERYHIVTMFEWVTSGSFSVNAGLLIDPLALTMCLFITGVGTLIHIYSVGYMHGDKNFSKFFIYLNLFIASMLLLVLGDNLLLTFLGWEGVGACSYLLISFWFEDESNASAGKKAFVTNRIGDFGYMLATFMVFFVIGSINYDDIVFGASMFSETQATVVVLLFLLAAAGKSAQLPLFVWLPDAMAGPTPVSALIHAATMVTSGVFLLTRLNPVLAEAAPWAMGVIAWVGAITALVAATIALAQNDIKKVLAYSTVSQLGYLFLAVGVGGYVAAIFHMITHAFFKALLFLGSGSVIHGLGDEQDMRRMGGLRKFMPVTAATFIVGWLAIAGVPPFSGFWSKDEILLYAWNADEIGGKALWAVGIVTAILTAFYMTRQVILTFFGRSRFFDPTPAEVDEAWAAKVAADSAGVDDAEATYLAAREKVDKATGEIEKRSEKVAESRELLATATSALAGATEGDEGYDKLVKALDRAEKAVPKAEAALLKATEAKGAAEAALSQAAQDHKVAEVMVAEAEAAAARAPRPAAHVTVLTEAVDIAAVEDNMPASFTERVDVEPHESPTSMTMPLIVLAGFAIVAGAINLPFTKDLHFLGHWLEPSLFGNEAHLEVAGSTKWILALIAIAGAITAIVAAFRVYMAGATDPAAIEKATFRRGWFIDESYANFFGGPGRRLFDAFAWFDRTIVDGAIRGIGKSMTLMGEGLRFTQSGYVRTYGLSLGLGAVLLMVWFLARLVA